MSDASPSTPPITSAAETSAKVRIAQWVVVCLATVLWFAAIINARPLLSANDRSRWDTVWSLAERGTYQIDEITGHRGWDTIDKVYHENHFYSSKPPLLATLVAGLYWIIKQVTGWTLLEQTALVAHVILIAINLAPMVAALCVLLAITRRYARTDATRLFVVLAAALGTLLTPFIVTLNNHTIAAVSVVFALYPALRIVADGARQPRYFGLAGFFAAFACTNELPAALFGVALFGLLARQSPRLTLAWFVPAALLPLGAFFLTNYWVTGGVRPFYTYFGTEKYNYVVDGKPSYWLNPQGIDKGGDSPLEYFMHCTIGHHGIFSLSPIYLLTLATWLRPRLWRGSPLAPFIGLGLGLSVLVLGFYLTRTDNYNYGGMTCGLRWMFWLIPFWLVSIIPVCDAWQDRRWFRWLAGLLLAISIFSALWPIENPWRPPWLFQLMETWGWIRY